MTSVRPAVSPADLAAAGQLLHDFNVEFDDPAPDPAWLAHRLGELSDATVLLAGSPPVGVCVLRLRPDLWTASPEAYLAELYVTPGQRRRGHGRALLSAALELATEHGASRVELGTSADDAAARALYEASGFTNLDAPDGASMLVYELELPG